MAKLTERRDGICPWKSIDHLKEAFSSYMSPEQIDKIVNKVTKNGTFKKREGVTDSENRDNLLNLVDSIIMKKVEEKEKHEKIC